MTFDPDEPTTWRADDRAAELAVWLIALLALGITLMVSGCGGARVVDPPPPARQPLHLDGGGLLPDGEGGASPPAGDGPAIQPDPDGRPDEGGPDSSPPPCQTGCALLVRGGRPGPGDLALEARLKGMGLGPVVMTDQEVGPASGTGRVVIVVTDTVDPALVAGQLRYTSTPLVVMKWELYWPTGMVASSGHARLEPAVGLVGIDPTQEMAQRAGLGESTILTIPAGPIGAATLPVFPANVVASTPSNLKVLFGFRPGVEMGSGQTAPSTRVGYGVTDGQVGALTPAGWGLFDAAILWAIKYSQ